MSILINTSMWIILSPIISVSLRVTVWDLCQHWSTPPRGHCCQSCRCKNLSNVTKNMCVIICHYIRLTSTLIETSVWTLLSVVSVSTLRPSSSIRSNFARAVPPAFLGGSTTATPNNTHCWKSTIRKSQGEPPFSDCLRNIYFTKSNMSNNIALPVIYENLKVPKLIFLFHLLQT